MSATALILAGCGGSSGSASNPPSATAAPKHAAAVPALTISHLRYRPLYSLPAALQDPAFAPLGGDRFALLGGIDAAGSSTADVLVANLGSARRTATLSGAQHDAQAAALGGKVYVFGGGDVSQYDHIISFDPAGGAVGSAGVLPKPASDVAVTQIGGAAYVIGGFDGSNWLDTIIAWRPGSGPVVAGHLPVGLRYAAVTAAGGRVLIIGGSTPSGASDVIYAFDPASGSVRQIGRLPAPVTHGGAATLGTNVFLVGGRGEGSNAQTAAVWSINPLTGSVRSAGQLPQGLSDAGVLSIGNAIVIAGGRSANGAQASVGELVPAP